MAYNREEILSMMRRRILILDGATGTYLQHLKLTEEDFRGSHPNLANHPQPLKGCNDILCVTRPEIIRQMHRDYILAGADIIETNSFNCNCFSLADYGLEDHVYEISKAAAQCAKEAATAAMEEGQREGKAAEDGIIIAGSMGPTNRTLSISPDVNDPAKRDITFDQLADTYYEQARGLVDGGADVLLVETIFDTLNAKAALYAIDRLASERGIDIPVMASGTLSDASGRTLSGQTVEAYYASLKHAHLLSIGLNCGFGAKQLLPWLKRLAAVADCAISVHPNAGLPNVMGEYDETPELFALHAEEFMKPDVEAPIARFVRPDSGCAYINIIGGCCGTTPDHIRAAAEVAHRHQPRPLLNGGNSTLITETAPTLLSGLELLNIPSGKKETSLSPSGEMSAEQRGASFINIGERTNVAGSAKFKRLIKEGNYEEAVSVARAQVNAGAQVIDICMDDGMIDGIKAMTTFLNLIASEPDIARVPVMIDSSKWEILKAGLQCVQGKSVVNSISLKEGEERFLDKARHVKAMGAAMVVMLFDENGQADTYERKVSVARRAYALLKEIGFPTEDVIFDPNVLAVATGMPEHDDYGRAFIEACRTIKEEMPEVHLSGGISNLSFSFRGNNTVRKAMHSVILHHARAVGLDMSIVNPAMTTRYEDIAPELKECVEDVILNKNSEAADRLLTLAQKIKEEEDAAKAAQEANGATTNGTTNGTTTNGKAPAPVLCEASGKPRSPQSLKERITAAFLTGNTDTIEEDAFAAYNETANALAVIEEYLMPAMEQVGKLFGEGKMFLPQVVKSARVMKKAVSKIEPFMNADKHQSESPQANNSITSPPSGGTGGGAFLIATVKGDVHDIGKNIVSVVTQCNGYRVKDLGVMVDAETIVTTAQEWGADVIGLSGLITPSLDEMINVVRLLESRGMTTPVIVGGATTSALHTAVKMAPEYPHGVVIHAHAAADNPAIIRHLTGTDREEYIAEHKNNQRLLRDNYLNGSEAPTLLSLTEARKRRWQKPQELVAKTECKDIIHHELSIETLLPLINWNMFHQAWGLKGDVRHGKEGKELKKDALAMLHEMHSEGTIKVMARTQILPAVSNDDDEIVVKYYGTDKVWRFAFPRSLKDEEVTNCLADHITREGGDSIAPFCVTAGIGLKQLQERYRKDDDEYRAIMAKLLCDRLAQAACDWLQLYLKDTVHWGKDNISMAFGYGACPDHSLKRHVFDILDIENTMGLHLTDSNMITPEESICGLIMANTPVKYFNV